VIWFVLVVKLWEVFCNKQSENQFKEITCASVCKKFFLAIRLAKKIEEIRKTWFNLNFLHSHFKLLAKPLSLKLLDDQHFGILS